MKYIEAVLLKLDIELLALYIDFGYLSLLFILLKHCFLSPNCFFNSGWSY